MNTLLLIVLVTSSWSLIKVSYPLLDLQQRPLEKNVSFPRDLNLSECNISWPEMVV